MPNVQFETRYGTRLPQSSSVIELEKEQEKTPGLEYHSQSVSNRRQDAIDQLLDVYIQSTNGEYVIEGGEEISVSSFNKAAKFLSALPEQIPDPEIDLDADGDVTFEWAKDARHSFLVSLSGDGVIAYSGLRGVKSFHGIEFFQDAIPQLVLDGIFSVLEN